MTRPRTLTLITSIDWKYIKVRYECDFGRTGTLNQNIRDFPRGLSTGIDVRKRGKVVFCATVQLIEYWSNRAENHTIRSGIVRSSKCTGIYIPLIPKCMEIAFLKFHRNSHFQWFGDFKSPKSGGFTISWPYWCGCRVGMVSNAMICKLDRGGRFRDLRFGELYCHIIYF